MLISIGFGSIMVNKESAARVRLAGRILTQWKYRGGQPIVPVEIAQLRFLAESDEEREMPIEKLALAVIERERRRIGYPPPEPGFQAGRRN